MRSLTYLLKNRVSSPEKFWSAAEKDFCNKIGPSATYIAQVSDPSEDAQTFVNVVVYLPDYPPRFLADQAGQKTHGEVVNGIELRSQDEITADAFPSAPSADNTS
jgi:hypothetical protein